ncbi:hypothetical protein SERLADRAFT_477656 [Serpula lacrymans var. lacrymans S7.9]|uniref:Uncharacterized protein n=1 Tax=Serpula lacrymans var. lacrymans (strain S7.9) TaxID=578457 RepID=F8P9D0_SERL9|nr:uncharacterized protein SERLADRAFT_477656 [Serpula lacrymans var. lacrymans S7.9]EGO20259.1 hypothetical protein SERLADRAFT_477656 [Serpula lacrymans var. lacrymans S7.9]
MASDIPVFCSLGLFDGVTAGLGCDDLYHHLFEKCGLGSAAKMCRSQNKNVTVYTFSGVKV